MIRSHVLVCGGTGCTSNKSAAVVEELRKQIAANGLDKEIQRMFRTLCKRTYNGGIS